MYRYVYRLAGFHREVGGGGGGGRTGISPPSKNVPPPQKYLILVSIYNHKV